jgi:hypothetical protein
MALDNLYETWLVSPEFREKIGSDLKMRGHTSWPGTVETHKLLEEKALRLSLHFKTQ